jgi:hypothetical protein
VALAILKVLVTALVVVAVSELGKRSSFWAATLASLPLTSLLAFIWMRVDGAEPERIAQLSTSIFWLVIPSLLLFLLFPFLLRSGLGFAWSLLLASGATALAYLGLVWLLPHFGVRL